MHVCSQMTPLRIENKFQSLSRKHVKYNPPFTNKAENLKNLGFSCSSDRQTNPPSESGYLNQASHQWQCPYITNENTPTTRHLELNDMRLRTPTSDNDVENAGSDDLKPCNLSPNVCIERGPSRYHVYRHIYGAAMKERTPLSIAFSESDHTSVSDEC
jgi:hypothetical protein